MAIEVMNRQINYESLLDRVLNNADNAVGVWIFRDTSLIKSFVKPGLPIPNKMAQQKMFVQAHLMMAMARNNENMYGKVNHLSVSFEYCDYFLFPLGRDEIIAVGFKKPYTIDDIDKIAVRIPACTL
jgi:hypothetical protein